MQASRLLCAKQAGHLCYGYPSRRVSETRSRVGLVSALPQLNQVFEILWYEQATVGCRLAGLIQFLFQIVAG